MTEAELREFIPDVYQRNIYEIDYELLEEAGIRLISFDIDDTLDKALFNKVRWAAGLRVQMPKEASALVRRLRNMSFTVLLITNAADKLARDASETAEADAFFSRANKPETNAFCAAATRYNLDPSQMAHIGNSITKDVVAANRFGAVSCLVRPMGKASGLLYRAADLLPKKTSGRKVRRELCRLGLWREHHMISPGDQYYQLGEIPPYMRVSH